MRKLLLVLVPVAVVAAVAWWLTRGAAPDSGAASRGPAANAGRGEPRAGAGGPTEPAAQPLRSEPKRPEVAPDAVKAAAPVPPADPLLVEQAGWLAEFGERSDDELATLVTKIDGAAEEERRRLFEDQDNAGRVESDWLAAFEVHDAEALLEQPGLVVVVRRVEGTDPAAKARFEFVYVRPEAAPELAAMQRQIAWFKARIGRPR